MRVCRCCQYEGDNFSPNGKFCRPCVAVKSKKYREENKDKVSLSIKLSRAKPKGKSARVDWIGNNQDKIKLYQEKRKLNYVKTPRKLKTQLEKKENNRKYQLERYHKKLKNNSGYKLRNAIRTTINSWLKQNKSSKNNNSFLQFVSWSLEELKLHLKSLFKPWMNWNNYGQYLLKNWKDEDLATWKWNVDHIIPQSLLPYASMEDENFKKCWALENLRPLSAKENLLKGNKI